MKDMDGNNFIESNPKRGRGRPLGSFGKTKKLKAIASEEMNISCFDIDDMTKEFMEIDGNNFIESNPKRGRGRPLGNFGKAKKLKAIASEGGDKAILTFGSEFTPAVVEVEPGEDLVEKVWALGKKNGPNVCILTATGTISRVDMLDDISGEISIHEGILQILYVKGSNESHFCMHVANEVGIVHRGTVCGQAIANEKIQVIAATFCGKGTKRKRKATKLSESQCHIETNSEHEQCQIETNSACKWCQNGTNSECQITGVKID